MRFVTISYEELSALDGLPWLQQILYLRGIKPHADYETGMVGVRRKISYQSLSEVLYVEPHPGITSSGSPSKDQLRRALKGLEKAGLIQIQSSERQLVFQCLISDQDYSVQNKPAIKQPQDPALVGQQKNVVMTGNFEGFSNKPAPKPPLQTATPHKDNNFIIFLLQNFEIFWESYPEKKSKPRAWDQFQQLNPDETLFSQIMQALTLQVEQFQLRTQRGLWSAPWKFPANWLEQECWKETITPILPEEKTHGTHQKSSEYQSTEDSFWNACKAGAF